MHLIDFSPSLTRNVKRNFQGVQCEFMEVAMNYFSLFSHFYIACVDRIFHWHMKMPRFPKFINTSHFFRSLSIQNLQKLATQTLKNGLIWKKFVGYKLFHLRDITTTLIGRVNYQQYGDDVIHGVHGEWIDSTQNLYSTENFLLLIFLS